MNHYVSPERRRRRRMGDGPEGEEPAEFTPQRVVRVMRCPKCRETIATMRRWRMACNGCGHEWEEESVVTAADKLEQVKTEAAEYAVMALMWAGLVLTVGAVIGFFIFVGFWFVGGAGGLVVGTVLLLMLACLGGMARSRNERFAHYS